QVAEFQHAGDKKDDEREKERRLHQALAEAAMLFDTCALPRKHGLLLPGWFQDQGSGYRIKAEMKSVLAVIIDQTALPRGRLPAGRGEREGQRCLGIGVEEQVAAAGKKLT